jgi:hypothetical protein
MSVHGRQLSFGDIKYLRELNRHRELVVLAQAWRLTGRERYLDGIATCSWRAGLPSVRIRAVPTGRAPLRRPSA